MRKHNQIHTLGAPHYKEHLRFLRKLRNFKCALWSQKHVRCHDLFSGYHWLTAHAKTCERLLRCRVVCGDNCGVVWVSCTTWCSLRAAHPKNEYREFALSNHRQSSNLGLQNFAKFNGRFLVIKENAVW